MYAVVELQWHQYIVSEGLELVVDKVDFEVGQTFDVRVLALFSEDAKHVTLGSPVVDGASVTFTMQGHQRGEKIRVLKFKRKNRYERNFGHRSYQSVLVVNSVNGK